MTRRVKVHSAHKKGAAYGVGSPELKGKNAQTRMSKGRIAKKGGQMAPQETLSNLRPNAGVAFQPLEQPGKGDNGGDSQGKFGHGLSVGQTVQREQPVQDE